MVDSIAIGRSGSCLLKADRQDLGGEALVLRSAVRGGLMCVVFWVLPAVAYWEAGQGKEDIWIPKALLLWRSVWRWQPGRKNL